MRNILALAAAAAVLMLASAANAAGPECVNGYQMLGHEIIHPCSATQSGPALAAGRTQARAATHVTSGATGSRSNRGSASFARYPGAPSTTGSINPEASRSIMATSPQDCVPGEYWMMTSPDVGSGDFSVPMACR